MNLRNRNCYYVDKTPYIEKLIDRGEYYFLSRPRRFGKTLLVDTMQELFEGNEKLFRGLHIHDRWDWNISNPVVRMSFDGNYGEPGSLHDDFLDQLEELEKDAGIDASSRPRTEPRRLRNIILKHYKNTGQQVVVLVDEYDKPILDLLENKELAEANRAYLHGVYGIIKGCAKYIRFMFVTGISMYSKVRLFSGLNILEDISLDPEFATICGYTDTDIDTVFTPELKGLDRDEIRHWYNGYSWLGEEKVYNPFDVLLLFKKRQFEPFWYETGTLEYLYRILAEGKINTPNLEHLKMDKSELSNFKVEEISVNALLFQCGYLTIINHEIRPAGIRYSLEYPNHAVRLSLNQQLLGAVSGNFVAAERRAKKMARFLADNEFEEFGAELRSFFSNIPNEWYVKSRMQYYEGFYASMVYACFTVIGVNVTSDASTRLNRSDLVVMHAGEMFVIRFIVVDKPKVETKVKAEAVDASAQMQEKDHAGKYRHRRGKNHVLDVLLPWRGLQCGNDLGLEGMT